MGFKIEKHHRLAHILTATYTDEQGSKTYLGNYNLNTSETSFYSWEAKQKMSFDDFKKIMSEKTKVFPENDDN